MASPARVAALALLAGLAVLGLALGAASQKEFVLESDLENQGRIASSGAAGNLVVLTAVPVALGIAGALALLSRQRVVHRLLPAAAAFGGTYLGVVVGQTMWPAYAALLEQRQATLNNSLLAANLDGLPSVLLLPLSLMLGAVLATGWAARRLLAPDPAGDPTPQQLLRGQAAATLLAVPFLAVVAWGNVRLLLALPDDRPGLGPYLVVLPAVALGCLALAALAVAKTWQLGTYVRNARLAAAVQDAWQALGRAEGGVLALLGGLAVAGTALQAAGLPELEVGRVLGLTLRGHTQMLVLLAIPLAPLARLHRSIRRRLDAAPLHPSTLDDRTDPLARATLAVSIASAGLAAAATWGADTALWAWLLALLPAAGAAATLCGPRHGAPASLLVAFVLWAIGNTVQATYAGGEGSAILAFVTPPGLLALWRTLGAVVAAATLARLAQGIAGRPGRTWPLAAGAGLALAGVALLEMPLTAWLLNRPGVDAIAVGSVVASLDPPVRATVHVVAGVLGIAAALLVALLHRPDWFARPPRRPVAVVRPKPARAGARAEAV